MFLVFSLTVYSVLLGFKVYQIDQQPPETIEIHRYYNEESQVECFYHQNAMSCLWVMGEVK